MTVSSPALVLKGLSTLEQKDRERERKTERVEIQREWEREGDSQGCAGEGLNKDRLN